MGLFLQQRPQLPLQCSHGAALDASGTSRHGNRLPWPFEYFAPLDSPTRDLRLHGLSRNLSEPDDTFLSASGIAGLLLWV
jgi:hypothetical protein